MKEYVEIEAASTEGSAFSNGHEWDCWSGQWCERCVHDVDIDSGGCPLVFLAMQGERTPAEWVPGPTGPRGEPSLPQRYRCTQFEARPGFEPKAIVDITDATP